jgi:hypothetical protein
MNTYLYIHTYIYIYIYIPGQGLHIVQSTGVCRRYCQANGHTVRAFQRSGEPTNVTLYFVHVSIINDNDLYILCYNVSSECVDVIERFSIKLLA